MDKSVQKYFAILFQADTNENALHFVGDIVKPIEGVAATSTLPIAPLRTIENPRKRKKIIRHWMPRFYALKL